MIPHLLATLALLQSAKIAASPLSPYPSASTTTVIQSSHFPGVSLSFKEPGICENTPGVRSYSGFLNLPSSAIEDVQGGDPYNISTFFWFFESRDDPANAPLAVYLAGGPGEASTYSAVSENGPCYISEDSNSTYLNPWSFNNHVNMLYIDQPVQAGYSYDTLVSGTLNLITNVVTPLDTSEPNSTLLAGTFPSQNTNTTANTTAIGARTLWHFTQTWLTEFPQYAQENDTSISLWGNSYGGYYVPGYSAFFQEQNEKIKNGTIQGQTIGIDTIGITNGCIDSLLQAPFYPIYAVNNTYDFATIPPAIAEEALNNHTKPGGCRDLIIACRELEAVGDPYELGNNDTVNQACALAQSYCFAYVLGAYSTLSNRSDFDISVLKPNAYPPLWPVAFFNSAHVQAALGAPLNWTYSSNAVGANFLTGTGDIMRRSIAPLNYLLQSGVNVAMVYGDRDYKCNWMGAENVSLEAEWSGQEGFNVAGYTNITVNGTYTGGVVRQINGLSFSRVFDASHAVSASQPETVSKIFDRAMLKKDVATGEVSVATASGNGGSGQIGGYSTEGPLSSMGIRNKLPSSPPVVCDIWGAYVSCTDEQLAAMANGTAVVEDWIVVSPAAS